MGNTVQVLDIETKARKATRQVLEQVLADAGIAIWVKDIVSAELTRRDNRPFKVCPDLMDRLQFAQNHDANINQDIMTWAAMCDTREELERHVIRYEERAANYIAPTRRRKVA